MNTQQGFARTWIIIASFITLLIASLWLWTDFRNQNNHQYQIVDEQVNVATSTDEFADWKVYKNEEYAFSFEYPGDFTLDDSVMNNDGLLQIYFRFPFKSQSYVNVTIRKGNFADNAMAKSGRCTPEEYISIGDDMIALKNSCSYEDYVSVAYYIKLRNGDTLVIDNQRSIGLDAGFEYLSDEVFTKILDSFKYILPKEAVNWKTYRNEEYGFEFKLSEGDVVEEEDNKNNPLLLEIVSDYHIEKRKSDCWGSCFTARIYVEEKELESFDAAYIKSLDESNTNEVKEIMIDGVKGYSKAGNDGGGFNIYLYHNSKMYNIYFWGGYDQFERDIMMTFKFTN